MLLFLLSLAGIPPAAGFLGKYYIFPSLIESGHYTLAAVAVVYVLFGLYYYLKIANAIFVRQAVVTEPLTPGFGMRTALGVAALATLVIGIYPEPFIQSVNWSLGTRLAAELGISDRRRMLGVDRTAAVSGTLVANLQPLGSGEQIVVQWVLNPIGPVGVVPPARKRSGRPTLLAGMWDGIMARDDDPEVVKAARVKQSSPLFVAVGRIGVVAEDRARARGLLTRVLAAFHLANAPGVHLRRRWSPSRIVAKDITERRLPLLAPACLLNAAELAALVGFPMGDVSLPGLRLGGSRQLAPASDIPTGGRVVAQATFPGGERPLALSVTDSLRHLHVIGPTGVGKSTLLLSLITQDIAAGRRRGRARPQGRPGERRARVRARQSCPGRCPSRPHRREPAGRPQPARRGERRPRAGRRPGGRIFHQLYRAFWGPRTDDILRAALLTLVSQPGVTLCEVPLILTDPGFRRRLVGRIDDPVALGPFWGWYEGMSDAERAQAIGPVMNKLRAFLLRRRLRNMLGQATPRFDFDLGRQTSARSCSYRWPRAPLGEEAAALLDRRWLPGCGRRCSAAPESPQATGRRRSPSSTSSRTT